MNQFKFLIIFEIFLFCLGLSNSAQASELMGPIKTGKAAIVNESNVVVIRGAKIELFPERRVVPTVFNGVRLKYQTNNHVSSDLFEPNSQGVIFNHIYQRFGAISGEIAFSITSGNLSDLNVVNLNGFKKLGNLDMYVVHARNPDEFKKYIELLSTETKITWVEPTIDYSIQQ